MGRILIVEDERSIRLTLKAFLEGDGHQVLTAEEAASAMTILKENPIDLVITDIIMPKVSGVQLLQQIKEALPEILVIMMTGEPTLETVSESLRHGAADYLQKPVGKTDILKTVQNVIRIKQLNDEKKRLEEENRLYTDHLEELVAQRTRELTLSEAALRRQAEELGILNRLAREVGARMTVDATIKAGVRHILKAVSPDLAVVFLLENEELVLNGLFPEGTKQRWQPEVAHRVGGCLCGLCISQDQTIYSEDIHSDERCKMNECKKAGFRSFAALVIKSGSETLGVIGLASEQPRDFRQDGSFLEALANELAVGLKKSLLYEQLKQRAEEVQESLNKIKKGEAQRLQLQQQLQQAQKMEAIGTLAGGIAHDFNNILSAIIGYTEIAIDDQLPTDATARKSLENVLIAASRAKELVKQILAFSRQSQYDKKPISLGHIVKDCLKLLLASLPANIEIQQNLLAYDSRILGEPTHIHQVLMNLCTNAAYALRDTGGILKVELEKIEYSLEDQEKPPDMNPGKYLKLTITDTGPGMGRSVLEQIFNPFFTTKPKEEGTGLGLPVVHGIVTEHKGKITVDSQIGRGTSFTIYFPQIDDSEELSYSADEPLTSGNERILIVDDEKDIVDTSKIMIERLGYTVTSFTNSIEALELFSQDPTAFDLLITDQTMPKMTGDQLARKILNYRPDIPIILCTGFSHVIDEVQAEALGIREFIMKPVIRKELIAAIRRALDKRQE